MCDAAIGFIGVIIGAIIGLIPYFMERKERYKFESYKNELERQLEEFKKDLEIKYEVRIKTHQEAFSMLMDLSGPLHESNKEKIYEQMRESKKWWNKNCFFLDKNSRSKFLELINTVWQYGGQLDKTGDFAAKISEKTWNLLYETINAVQDGIKVERLDVLEKPEKRKED